MEDKERASSPLPSPPEEETERDTVPLELKAGENQVRFAGATAYLEPSSVVLRDPGGKHRFQILEQSYRGDPVSQSMLLELNEGKTIKFELTQSEGGQTKREVISGKIIRSGEYDPRTQPCMGCGGNALQPIIEVGRALLLACGKTPSLASIPC